MPIEYHGISQEGGGSATVTSLALPAAIGGGVQPGTSLGDLLVVVATVGSGSGSWDLSVSDSRFSFLRELDAPNAPDGTAWSQGGVWVGTATSLAPITMNLDAGTGATDVAKVACIALGATLADARSATHTATSNSYTLPGLSGRNRGALVLTVGRMGLGNANWTNGGAYSVKQQGDAYCKVAIGLIDDASTTNYVIGSQAVSWDDLGTGGTVRTASLVIALDPIRTGAPPCRNTGRDDSLGVGIGRNMPTRSQQSGFRNTGYY